MAKNNMLVFFAMTLLSSATEALRVAVPTAATTTKGLFRRVPRTAPFASVADADGEAQDKVDVAVVGAGLPGRGMGWFHALQVVSGACPSARLTDVVEPWFLGGGKDSDAGRAFFKDVVEPWTQDHGVAFSANVAEAFSSAASSDEEKKKKRLALVAGRTADNPSLFRGAIEAGATHVLLEKPGAPSVTELEAMEAFAEKRGVPVFMGFIKNISPYLARALYVAKEAATGDALVTLSSFNSYAEDQLGECFKRNAEGMLKNMAIHELALAVDYFGITVDTLDRVVVNSGDARQIDGLTDIVRVDLELIPKKDSKANAVRVVADRCGSQDGCAAAVAVRGVQVATFPMVDDARAKKVADRQKAHPDWIGYLLTQEDEYQVLKETCCAAALRGDFPVGVATIRTAIEALKLAEHLTPIVTDALLRPTTQTTQTNKPKDPAPTAADNKASQQQQQQQGGPAANTSVFAR